MPELELATMAPTEFARWQEELIAGYAESHLRAGTWDAAHALAAAQQEFARLLPSGVDTPGHTIRHLVDVRARTTVGSVWLFVAPAAGAETRRGLFVYWVGVDPKFRGQGFGKAAMELIEREARRAGAGSVALHVFADNPVALRLYRACGYEETSYSMRKVLQSPEGGSAAAAPSGAGTDAR